MTPLRFYIARLMGNEPALAALSASRLELFRELEGKSVALVGNARSLADSDCGKQIDSADLVIRINRAPMPSQRSHGSRTDWLALAVRLSAQDRDRINPERILWMSHKRKRLTWDVATSDGFFLNLLSDYRALKNRLDAPPSTGALMIDKLLKSELARLTLFGFDFFTSQSLSGSRTAAQVPHDFTAESDWIGETVQKDGRLELIGPDRSG